MTTRYGYPQLRCQKCGKYLGLLAKDYYSYIPWGSSIDTEPPDEEYFHKKCITKENLDFYSNPKNVWQPIILQKESA